jgi:hypothetical protein
MSDVPKIVTQLLDSLESLRVIVAERAEIKSMENLRRERAAQAEAAKAEAVRAVAERDAAKALAASILNKANEDADAMLAKCKERVAKISAESDSQVRLAKEAAERLMAEAGAAAESRTKAVKLADAQLADLEKRAMASEERLHNAEQALAKLRSGI